MKRDPAELLTAASAGDRVALARLLTIVERGGEVNRVLAALVYKDPPPFTVGITGAPGAGKSTLTDRLITAARGGWPAVERAEDPKDDGTDKAPLQAEAGAQEAIDQIAVLAVDPSSPFSGGAILGDRVRMQQHATDPTVYIRSMATRGHLGGLAVAVPEAVRVLGSVGFPIVIAETVGVGQMEVDIASAAETTVVVVTPGWGDSMQANKAGLLEVADIFVVNKADRPGKREARRDLEQMLDLSIPDPSGWRPPIVDTVAANGEGVAELWATIARHRVHLLSSGALERRRRTRLSVELRKVLVAEALRTTDAVVAGSEFAEAVDEIAEGRTDPYAAADRLLRAASS